MRAAARPRLQNRVADVIRKRRKTKWTQEGFADHINMHRAQYGLVERGGKDVQLSTLERIAAGFGEPVWVLIREAEES